MDTDIVDIDISVRWPFLWSHKCQTPIIVYHDDIFKNMYLKPCIYIHL